MALKLTDQQILQHLRRVADGNLRALSDVSLKGIARDMEVFVEEVERVHRAALAEEESDRAGVNSKELRRMLDAHGASPSHEGRGDYGGIPFGPWNVSRAPKAPTPGDGVMAIVADTRERVGRFAQEIAEDPLTGMALEVFLLREMTKADGERLAPPSANGSWSEARRIVNSMELDWNAAQRALVKTKMWHPKHHISPREFEAATRVSPSDYIETYLSAEMTGEQLIRARVKNWGARIVADLAADAGRASPETLTALREAIERRRDGQDVSDAVRALSFFPLGETLPILLEQLDGPSKNAAIAILGEHARKATLPLAGGDPLLDPALHEAMRQWLDAAILDRTLPRDIVLAASDILRLDRRYDDLARDVLGSIAARENTDRVSIGMLNAIVDRVLRSLRLSDEPLLRRTRQLMRRTGAGSAAEIDAALGRIDRNVQALLIDIKSAKRRSHVDGRSAAILDVIDDRAPELAPGQLVRVTLAASETLGRRFEAQGDHPARFNSRLWPGDAAFIIGLIGLHSRSMPLDEQDLATLERAIAAVEQDFNAQVVLPNGERLSNAEQEILLPLFARIRESFRSKRDQGESELEAMLGGKVAGRLPEMTDVETLLFLEAARRQARERPLDERERGRLRTALLEVFDYWNWPVELVPTLRSRAESLLEAFSP